MDSNTTIDSVGKYEVRVLIAAMLLGELIMAPPFYVILNLISETSEPAPLWAVSSFAVIWSYFCMQLARGRSPYLDVQLSKKG